MSLLGEAKATSVANHEGKAKATSAASLWGKAEAENATMIVLPTPGGGGGQLQNATNLCRPNNWSVVINCIENFQVDLNPLNCICWHKLLQLNINWIKLF